MITIPIWWITTAIAGLTLGFSDASFIWKLGICFTYSIVFFTLPLKESK